MNNLELYMQLLIRLVIPFFLIMVGIILLAMKKEKENNEI